MTINSLNPRLRIFEALSDGEVVTRVLQGDQALFELLMRRYNRRLFRYSRGILNDDTLAQDAVQEAYLNAFKYLHQFRGPHGFGAWLMRITTNSAIRIGRKESGIRLVGSSIDPDLLRTDSSAEPETVTMRAEATRSLENAVDRLPRDYRVIFILRELEGMSIEETSSLLGIKAATVKTRLHRAKHILRQRFKYRLEEFRSMAYAFDGHRCDSIVTQVFRKLAIQIHKKGDS